MDGSKESEPGCSRKQPAQIPSTSASYQSRPDWPSWTTAIGHGDDAELRVADWFKSIGFAAYKSVGQTDIDLLIQAGIEIKNDRLAHQTGNVGIETEYRNEPSGIFKTRATYWVIVTGQTAYVVMTHKLRRLIQTFTLDERPAGDGRRARVRLVPVAMLRALPGVKVIDLGGAQ